jgi:hypothetical protein
MGDKEALKARIRALRAKTVENGCTEAEALAAAEKVMELLARHGMAPGDEEMAQEEIDLGRSTRSALEPLFGTIAWVCHCKAVLLIRDNQGVRYVGRDPWPEAAGYLHAVVVGATHRALREFHASDAYRRRYRTNAKLVAQHHFLSNFMEVLSGKLMALKRARNEAEEQRRDLALANRVVEGKGFQDVNYREARRARAFADAARAGVRAGENAHIGWGVGRTAAAGRLGSR